MALASINIKAMTNLVSAMDDAVSNLPYDRWGLQSALSPVDVDASPADGLTKVIGWVNGQVPGVKRRLALAQAIEAQKPGWQANVDIDESQLSTLDPATAQDLGAADAKKLKDSNGKLDKDLLAEIAKYQNDPYFAAGFAKGATPAELAQVVLAASRQRDAIARDPMALDYKKQMDDWKANYGTLLDAVGTTIATATRNTGDLAMPSDYAQQWTNTITADTYPHGGDAPPGQGAAASLLLRSGAFDTSFLNTVSDGVYAYEREHGKDGPVWKPRAWNDTTFEGPYLPDGSYISDPLANIMQALGHNADAAQHFFANGGNENVKINGRDVPVNSRLKYLIQDRTWATGEPGSDNGAGLGSALQAASTFYRDNGPDGKISAQVASQTFALIGSKTGDGKSDGFMGIGSHQGWKMWTGMRANVANMVASYAPDLMRVGGRSDSVSDALGGDWAVSSSDVFPPGGPWGAQMDRSLMAKLLGTLGEDPKNIDVVDAGVSAAGQLRMSYALQQSLKTAPNAPVDMITGDKYVDLVNGASSEMAGTLAFIIDNAYQGDKSNQEFQKKRAEALSKWVGIALNTPVLKVPAGPWTGIVIDQAKDYALGKIGEGPKQDAKSVYNQSAGATQDDIQHFMLNSLLANGYLDKKYYDQAGPGYEPPPAGALKKDANGNTVFDFNSPEFQEWARKGHNLAPWLNTNVVDPFRSKFPAMGAE